MRPLSWIAVLWLPVVGEAQTVIIVPGVAEWIVHEPCPAPWTPVGRDARHHASELQPFAKQKPSKPRRVTPTRPRPTALPTSRIAGRRATGRGVISRLEPIKPIPGANGDSLARNNTKKASPPDGDQSPGAPSDRDAFASKVPHQLPAELAGQWAAVARDRNGELTTIELRLDDRGWAELVLPSADGGATSTHHAVAFDNEELHLAGPNQKQTLGKLVEVNGRRMVLERTGRTITFVRL